MFALLPHAPRLEDLTERTNPLLRWTALIAHVEPEEIDSVPKGVRDIHAVKLMLDILHGSIEEIKLERGRAMEEAVRDSEEEDQIFQDGQSQTRQSRSQRHSRLAPPRARRSDFVSKYKLKKCFLPDSTLAVDCCEQRESEQLGEESL